MGLEGLDVRIEDIDFDKDKGEIVINFNPLRIPLKDLILQECMSEIVDALRDETLKIYESKISEEYAEDWNYKSEKFKILCSKIKEESKELEKIVCEYKGVNSLYNEDTEPTHIEDK